MRFEILKNFIVIEGLDGAGTSTQTKLLSQKINSSYCTFEPTDNKIGLLIRKILEKKVKVTPLALAHLFVSDRVEHLYSKDGIIQRCKNGQIVITDRYIFSSLAYQSLDVSFKTIFKINSIFPLPEIVFFINTSCDECQKRINSRGFNEELFENYSVQQNIKNNYLKAFSCYKKYGLNTVFLDGNLSIENLLEQELKYLKKAKII